MGITRRSRNDEEILEKMVDRYGMAVLVGMLSEIASEKAEHVRSNWQDEDLAEDWEATANRLERTSRNIDRYL